MKNKIVIRNPGIVAVETLFIFSKILTSQVPEERFTVSEIGDILSPKIAPQITAAAVISGDTPNPPPIPIKATPKVAAVPQEVPVQRVARAQVKLAVRSEEHTSELQSRQYLVCRLLLE